MPGNSFGQIFRITTFGESHGEGLGVVVDGCPADLEVDISAIQKQMDRRRPGQSSLVTQRKEKDLVKILSGIYEDKTTGSPICLILLNEDARSTDYSHLKEVFRPSHADYTYQQKYGHRDYRGGGRASARETAARVAAGALAAQLLAREGISIQAWVSQVGDVLLEKNYEDLDLSKIEDTEVRCPDSATAEKMIAKIQETRKEGDSIGGIITGLIKGCPVGLGEPVFDKLHADLAKAMLSINACKGFEYGSGFRGASMKGSQHNDIFTKVNDRISTQTNYSGGIQGGISNGMDIFFKVAFKPVATILKKQQSIDRQGKEVEIRGRGRHDPCIVPRAVPIVEAMAALVLADHWL
ncbi:MAG TPA: chorismate synthase, partial [Phaeodactylibacter sp.]|nr:chorismate synthase [Phaeodactylibacter sp.]